MGPTKIIHPRVDISRGDMKRACPRGSRRDPVLVPDAARVSGREETVVGDQAELEKDPSMSL